MPEGRMLRSLLQSLDIDVVIDLKRRFQNRVNLAQCILRSRRLPLSRRLLRINMGLLRSANRPSALLRARPVSGRLCAFILSDCAIMVTNRTVVRLNCSQVLSPVMLLG